MVGGAAWLAEGEGKRRRSMMTNEECYEYEEREKEKEKQVNNEDSRRV